MTIFSKLALAAALAAGIGGVVPVAPAYAGAKDKPAGDAGFSLSADVRTAAQAAQAALAANDLGAGRHGDRHDRCAREQ